MDRRRINGPENTRSLNFDISENFKVIDNDRQNRKNDELRQICKVIYYTLYPLMFTYFGQS